jgi:cell fate regulator YaaT (PSP1 superfamily)
MPIHPLPVFEADFKAAEQDRLAYEQLRAPKSIVVRFGVMKMVGEFPYDGREKPGCGSKIVVRTHRGTELGEMLTSTCPNSGCGKSVTRKEMLQYIENSGGRDYPFFSEGRALRVATREDLDKQARLEQSRHGLKMAARAVVERLALPVRIVDAEPILGEERLTFHFSSEERVEFRDLARELGQEFKTRVDVRQVGARDEARITADYERCGQYCCCKNFLKVLKPVSMKSAKMQKATLDPLKISGRCGRLMCCLRYEDSTYEELRKRLPHRKKRVGTPEGDGVVLDTQILTQLALVQLDHQESPVAVPVEALTEPASPVPVVRAPEPPRPDRREPPQDRRTASPRPLAPQPMPTPRNGTSLPTSHDEQTPPPPAPPAEGVPPSEIGHRRKRRRRRRRRDAGGQLPGNPPTGPDPEA